MIRYIENINISYRIPSSKTIQNFSIYRDIKKYRNIFDNITIFSADFSLDCMTGKKDYKWGKLMVS